MKYFYLCFVALSLVSCIKSTNTRAWDFICKGKSQVWEIKKITVHKSYYGNNTIADTIVINNPGEFIFEDDGEYKYMTFDGIAILDSNYNIVMNPFIYEISCLGSMLVRDSDVTGDTELFSIVFQSKKKLNLYLGKEYSTYRSGPWECSLFIECEKK